MLLKYAVTLTELLNKSCQQLAVSKIVTAFFSLKGIYAKFQVIRGFSQKIPADLLSYNKIHS